MIKNLKINKFQNTYSRKFFYIKFAEQNHKNKIYNKKLKF